MIGQIKVVLFIHKLICIKKSFHVNILFLFNNILCEVRHKCFSQIVKRGISDHHFNIFVFVSLQIDKSTLIFSLALDSPT